MTIVETSKHMSAWERGLKIGLFKKFKDWSTVKGIPKKVESVFGAQGLNYIFGQDWEKDLRDASEDVKKIVDEHKSEIIPTITEFLQSDKLYRELVVYFLRIYSVVMFAVYDSRGEKWLETDENQRINEILKIYGPEFPEEADPIKFDKLLSDFTGTIFASLKDDE